jgi:Trk K+ transport system NAD-binding subunit
VATTLPDTANATVILTVRERSAAVPIVATAEWEVSSDLLRRAGCEQVIQLGELLGREMARRIVARGGGRTHVIGQLDDLLIVEAPAAGTSLVGQTIRDSRLRERFNLNVVGVWQHGTYAAGSAGTAITDDMTLLLSGLQADFDAYDREVGARDLPPAFAVIVGGGRVGRATSRYLTAAGMEHKIVERASDRVADWSLYVMGDATDPETLRQAGVDRAASVAITTHDDDVNVYLTLYCRGLRPDIQILSRATLEQNVSTLHRAGADFVLSYVPMEATAIFDIVRRGNLLLLAEGLEVFTVKVPAPLVGKAIAECRIREETGCNVFAVRPAGGSAAPPDISARLAPGGELILIGNREDERRFFERYGNRAG